MGRIRARDTFKRRARIIAALERGREIATMAGAGGAGTGGAEAGLAERREVLRRWVARIGWTIAQMDWIEVARSAADAAWMKLVRDDPDGDTAPPEAEVLERLMAEVLDVVEHDRWPRDLHWSL